MDICSSPCIQDIQRKLDEVLQKLDEEDDPDDGGSVLFDLEEIEYVVCSEDCQGAEMDRFTLEVKRGSMTPEKREILDDQVMLAAKGCGDAVASQPDWWQVRLGADRPQLVLVFRVVGTRTYHQIALPWPANTDKPTDPPISAYSKGPFQAQLVLIDNSKFTVNCETEAEAQRVLNEAKALIESSKLGNPIREHISERKGVSVSVGRLVPTRADYYPEGQRNLVPAWRAVFTTRLPSPP